MFLENGCLVDRKLISRARKNLDMYLESQLYLKRTALIRSGGSKFLE